ncbi:FLYWCH zinc finger domain-containing protein [Phthorimaea operculella]|nr:FLYWCH zinc finger domain-containing protein [Phthorimaea operculella]
MKPVLLYKKYSFYQSVKRESTIDWTCVRRGICDARVITDRVGVLKRVVHAHHPHPPSLYYMRDGMYIAGYRGSKYIPRSNLNLIKAE